MADNTQINQNKTAGDIISTDDIGGGFKVQRVKVQYGDPGSATDVSLNKPMPITDFSLEVAQGNVSGIESILIRGHMPNQSLASGFVDISEFGDLVYLTTAETMNIASDSTSDTSNGDGLRTVLIQGVDNTGAAISETIIMNGTTNVLTSNSYLRVNSMIGSTVGVDGWNVGSITAIASSAATIQDEMDATESLSQSSHYTVPLGKSLYPLQLELNLAKQTGGPAPIVEFKVYVRLGGEGAAWLQLFDKRLDADNSNELDVNIPAPPEIVARSDIRIRANTDQNSTESRSRIFALLIDT